MFICETFVSFQGEINVGRLAYFIRVGRCNLRCQYCDTSYAWNSGYEVDINELVNNSKNYSRIIITGGEPFLQRDELLKFVKKLVKVNPEVTIEIETNGTIKPIGMENIQNIIYNVSLKLTNSKNKYEDRIKLNSIKWFLENSNSNFKFVVNNEDDIDEVNLLVSNLGIQKHKVFLMCEGKTKDEQVVKMEQTIKWCKQYNYNFTPRFHVLMWGNKRGV